MKPKHIKVSDRVAERQKKREERILALADSKMKSVLQSEDARYILSSILEFTGVHENRWRGNSEIYRMSGMREVGVFIQEWIRRADFDGYVIMLTEREKNERREESRDD